MTDNKTQQAAEELTQSLQEAYQTVIDSATAAQVRNIKFVETVFERGVEELKSQTETARALVETLAKQSAKQHEAFQTLINESVTAYTEMFYTPFSFGQKATPAATAKSAAK